MPPKTAILVCFCLFWLASCNLPENRVSPTEPPLTEVQTPQSPVPEETPAQSSHLKICLGQEPGSLFVYGDYSREAALVRQAIYDGPIDFLQAGPSAVILEKIPMQVDGDVFFEQVELQPREVMVDAWRKVVKLEEGVSYFPAGCQDFNCVQTYTGAEEVVVDQQVVRFSLRKGIMWSDGTELSANDSLYSYEVARELFPQAGIDTIPFTNSYQVIDAYTLEWRGLPGFQSGEYDKFFFHPLPRHDWKNLSADELYTSEKSSRALLGWGPFVIDAWQPGIEIRLSKNPKYFRSEEGLPKVDRLTFRFIPNREDALAAMLSGECDLLSPSFGKEIDAEKMEVLKENPGVRIDILPAPEWGHLDFGIVSLNNDLPSLFQSKLTRQAIAMCIDREVIISELDSAWQATPNSFLPETHPLYHAGVRAYVYDPLVASTLFEAVGWVDADGDASTPRTSQAIAGLEEGTALSFTLLTTPDEERQRIAQNIQENLAGCGVQMQIETVPADQLFLPGPEGKIFGRQFQSALFSWGGKPWPVCNLFTSQEIPGDYPQFPKGWGGANLSGYSSLEYDQTCILAQRALPGTPGYENYPALVQSIFSEDLPAIPLFFRQELTVSKANICEPLVDGYYGFSLWNLEFLSVSQDCLE